MKQTRAIGVWEVRRVWWHLAAEEEDPGEASGGDAAPDNHRRREQGPVAVHHLRFFLLGWLPPSLLPMDGDWRRKWSLSLGSTAQTRDEP